MVRHENQSTPVGGRAMTTMTTGLTELERQVLDLYAYDDRRPDHIADQLQVPVSTVRSVLHRCCSNDPGRALRILAEYPDAEPEIPSVGQAEMIAIGLSYRQLYYWTSIGHLQVLGDVNPGSGRSRRWPIGEVRVASVMWRLINAGLDLNMAARVARDGRHELAPGIRLVIDEDGT
jgi:hypothetical protein